MQVYTMRDGFDCGGIQNEIREQNAKEEVYFQKKVTVGKEANKYCLLI